MNASAASSIPGCALVAGDGEREHATTSAGYRAGHVWSAEAVITVLLECRKSDTSQIESYWGNAD
jgi:hypothetical protein